MDSINKSNENLLPLTSNEATGWVSVLHRLNSLASLPDDASSPSPALLHQLQEVIRRLQTSEEQTIVAQIQCLLHLYQIRELLTAYQHAEHICVSGVTCSLFDQFLVWAYGNETAEQRGKQMMRMANWFQYCTDMKFYERLCNQQIATKIELQDEPFSVVPAASSSSSTDPIVHISSAALSPLTITYFYILSPRLHDIIARTAASGCNGATEIALHMYLSLRPISRLKFQLSHDFVVATRGSQQEEEAEQHTQMKAAAWLMSKFPIDQADDNDDESSQDIVASPVEDNDIGSNSNNSNSTNNSSTEEDDISSTNPSTQRTITPTSDVNEEEKQAVQETRRSSRRTNSSISSSSSVSPSSSVAETLRHNTEQEKPKPTKLKRKLGSSISGRGLIGYSSSPPSIAANSAAVASPNLPTIPCVRTAHTIPLELLALGVSAWQRKRQLSSEDASHRTALDGAITDLMWELYDDELTDGERVSIPEFKKARRSEERVATAARSQSMQGERSCNLLHNVLQTIINRNASTE